MGMTDRIDATERAFPAPFASQGIEGLRRARSSCLALGKSAPRTLLALFGAAALAACATSSPFGIAQAQGAADPALQDLARRAAEGDQEAQLTLGIRYEEGSGVAVNYRRAERLYERAGRPSGGTMLIYNPPPGPGQAGSLQRLDHGPPRPGLAAARERLERLRARLRRSTDPSGTQLNPEENP